MITNSDRTNETIPSSPPSRLTMQEVREMAIRAADDIPGRVRHWASIMGIKYGRITIRNQKTRWASCSSLGNLNFNCLMMLMPEPVRDYLVVHELCHLKEMNHSRRFWAEVEAVLPDYKRYEKWLKKHGEEIMGRMWG